MNSNKPDIASGDHFENDKFMIINNGIISKYIHLRIKAFFRKKSCNIFFSRYEFDKLARLIIYFIKELIFIKYENQTRD